MNIKGMGFTSFQNIQKAERSDDRKLHTESSSDREADGRRHEGEEPQEELTEERILAAIEHLKNLNGVKDNNLVVKRSMSNGHILLLITDPYGKVIRRIPEHQIHGILKTQENERGTGHLLDRAM